MGFNDKFRPRKTKKYHGTLRVGEQTHYEKNKILKYNYWSSFSGLKDQLENYAVVTYKLEQKNNGQTVFTWQQEGFANEAGKCHSENGLKAMLDQIKKIAEV